MLWWITDDFWLSIFDSSLASFWQYDFIWFWHSFPNHTSYTPQAIFSYKPFSFSKENYLYFSSILSFHLCAINNFRRRHDSRLGTQQYLYTGSKTLIQGSQTPIKTRLILPYWQKNPNKLIHVCQYFVYIYDTWPKF